MHHLDSGANFCQYRLYGHSEYVAYVAILRPLSVRWHCLVNGFHTEALVTLKLIFLF